MRRTTANHTRALFAGTLLLLAGYGMASTIEAVQFTTGSAEDRIFLRLSQASAVQVDQYPEARQAVVTFRGASVQDEGVRALSVPENALIEKARLQDVTLPDGTSAVRLTLTLAADASVEPLINGLGITLVVTPKVAGDALRFAPSSQELAAVRADVPSAPALVFDNTRLDAWLDESGNYGSVDAPATGAGQSETRAATPGFFVPEELTPEERAASVPGGVDQGYLRTEAIFRRPIERMDFKDTELQNVLRLIANDTNMNLLLDPALTGNRRVTLTLRDVSIGDAFEAILRTNNLAYKIETGGIVRIVNRRDVQTTEKETTTEAVSINWVAAADVKKALEPFVTETSGKIEVATGSNTVIIRDVPENLARIQELIRRIDTPEKQVKMEVRLVDMTENASRELGFRTSFTGQESFTATDVGEDGRIEGAPNEEGVFTPSTITEVIKQSGAAGRVPVGDQALSYTGRTFARVFGTNYLFEYQLRAQESMAEAVVLANPVVMSLNNQEASVEILRREPYLSAQQSGSGSVATVEFLDIGTQVVLLPRITNNGYVQLSITPEQSILREFREITPGRSVPVVDERRVTTSVIVRDDATVALGGLRQFESNVSETGVPYLMRAPFVSWLFKSNRSQQLRTELVLFVTPHIIKDLTPTGYEQALYEKIDYNWDLPDYYFDQVSPRKAPGEVDPRIKYQ